MKKAPKASPRTPSSTFNPAAWVAEMEGWGYRVGLHVWKYYGGRHEHEVIYIGYPKGPRAAGLSHERETELFRERWPHHEALAAFFRKHRPHEIDSSYRYKTVRRAFMLVSRRQTKAAAKEPRP